VRVKPSLDPRLPLPGTPLIRRYQGKDIIVHVGPDGGFECNGRIYTSLSRAVAEATGTRWNGFAFFNRAQRKSAGSARNGSDRSSGRGLMHSEALNTSHTLGRGTRKGRKWRKMT
jgi:hypothetical protein